MPYPGYLRTRSPAERSASRGNLPGWRLRLIRATQQREPGNPTVYQEASHSLRRIPQLLVQPVVTDFTSP